MSKQKTIDERFREAIRALEKEIEAVREQPSSDVLFGGRRESVRSGGESADYRFSVHQPSIRYAEELKGTDGKTEWKLTPVQFDKNEIVLRFPEDPGEEIEELQVEWENDFVLQRTLRELERLEDEDEEVLERIRLLFEPESETANQIPGCRDDGIRNPAQKEAIEKALGCSTLFVWGPPGTGKTATLGYIIANFLRQRKRVLFASNTNRAVDVGLLSAIDAIDRIGLNLDRNRITRFGEPVVEDDRLGEIHFDAQVERRIREKREEAGEWTSLLERRSALMEQVEQALQDGESVPGQQEQELEMIEAKIKKLGGREVLETKIEELGQVNERGELRRRELVATTLAKVATSELFFGLEYDAVVIDEGSMANLPYLMVLAARARSHRVVVGDPMQLPPISVTDNREAQSFLEKDIFIEVSGADTTGELFEWHDRHPEFTSFFDLQYRMQPALADLISSAFYEGRLQSLPSEGEAATGSNGRAYHLIDTSRYRPVLEQEKGERGFRPVNEVHGHVIERLIGNMLAKGIRAQEIGVMVPFRSSVYALRSRLWEANIRDVEIGTIHTFQGREKPYIIFDTVMSGEVQRGRERHYSVRPLDEEKNGLSVPRLLNVAFSRSRKELMILADMRHIRRIYGEKFLGRLLQRMES